jgi:type IV fimbrial biogenesis protein FimT
MKQQSGFTFIELMITIAVLAVIAALAAPNFRDTLERNRVQASIQDVSAALRYARSEAIKRNGRVTICASSDQATCTGSWNQGWIIFQDVDAAGDFDAGTDTLLRVNQAITLGHTLTFTGAVTTHVTFNSRGFTTGQSGTFKLCNKDKKNALARGVILQSTGSLRFAIDSNGDAIYEDAAGTNFSC